MRLKGFSQNRNYGFAQPEFHIPRPEKAIPKLQTHKASKRALVTICGRDIYLAEAGSMLAKKRYDLVIREYLANNSCLPGQCGISLAEIILMFDEHAQTYYRERYVNYTPGGP